MKRLLKPINLATLFLALAVSAAMAFNPTDYSLHDDIDAAG